MIRGYFDDGFTRAGIGRKDLAGALGVSYQLVCFWAAGDRTISEDHIAAVVKALQVPDADLRDFIEAAGHDFSDFQHLAAAVHTRGAALMDLAARAGSPPPVDPTRAEAA